MMNEHDVAVLIKTFVDGTCGNYDWDDFTSVPQKDAKVEALRQQLLKIGVIYPSNDPAQWCNSEGTKELLRIADSIK